jgi:hypothetical protein
MILGVTLGVITILILMRKYINRFKTKNNQKRKV